MNLEKLQRLQAMSKDCKSVYVVMIKCDGEDEIDAIWKSRESANTARDAHNNMKGNGRGYYGRARVVPMPVRTDEIARLLFADEQPAAGA